MQRIPVFALVAGAVVAGFVCATDARANADGGSDAVGKTAVFLNGERASVRSEETNLGNLVADAVLATARKAEPSVDIAVVTARGIRSSVGVTVAGSQERLPTQANAATGKSQGDITQYDIQNALRFDDSLAVLTVTAAELVAIMEHSVAAAAPGATSAQFPQVGGLRFSFDPGAPAGARIQTMALYDDDGDHVQTVVLDGNLNGTPTRTFRIVTLSFLADGGDNYPFPAGDTASRVDLTPEQVPQGSVTFAPAGSEQHALAAYLFERFPDANQAFDIEDVPAELDERIQNLSVREDTVVPLL